MLKFALVASVLMSCSQAPSHDSPASSLPDTINLEPVSELAQHPSDEPQETLINSRLADPADFPASVYASMGNSRCTATVVGEQVLVIAAHCVRSGGAANFRLGAESYTSVCTHSADYQGNPTADYTLCKVDRPITGIKYEVLNQNENLLKVGDELLLTGFGCVSPGGGGGNDGKYRIGESVISRTPIGTDNDIHTSGPGALCFGDSGGPAFKYIDAAKTKRVQVSINSRGDIRINSYLSSLSTQQAKRFLNVWLAREKLTICGVNSNSSQCRGSMMPSPSTTCKDVYSKIGQCLKVPTIEGCGAAYDFLLACLK